MIKALYFETRPRMDSVGALELLNELNPLLKDNLGSSVIPIGKDREIVKDSFITDNYFITFFKVIGDPLTLSSILKVYEIMQLSIPSFLKVLKVRDSIIVATPKYENSYENASYSLMMDELVRFTTYCFKRTGDEVTSSIMLKEYVEMYVTYPNTKQKGDNGK